MFDTSIEFFDEFINTCIIDQKSLLTESEDEKLFNQDNLVIVEDFLKIVKSKFEEKNKNARNNNQINNDLKEKIWSISDIFTGTVFKALYSEENKDVIVRILLHCNWLMYLYSERQHKQNTGKEEYYKKDIEKYFETEVYWSVGQAFSGYPFDPMLFIVQLLNKIISDKSLDNKDSIKNTIHSCCIDVDWKNGLKWKETDKKAISSDAISNILLFLCRPKLYLPIPAQNKKILISGKLSVLNKSIDEEAENRIKDLPVIDQTLYRIRENIKKINSLKYSDLNPFWLPDIRPFWDDTTSNLDSDTIPVENLLEFKKAMVFYGPPGTSKSYQARRMAENIIAKDLWNKNKNDIEKCLSSFSGVCQTHIHQLQLHPNYTYEDFIIGKSISESKKGGTTITVKPGKLMKIIAGIKSDDLLPHIVILDEINRVDISRVFGELFTAMEPSYRKSGIELTANPSLIEEEDRAGLEINKENGKLYLRIPNNLFFIGTMNMIDFSLEQVDFALRRRFLWQLSSYDEKRLEDILSERINEKIKVLRKPQTGNQDQAELNKIKLWKNRPDDFVDSCTKLNRIIEWESNLGKDYLIGHAFFAEIVDILERVENWDTARNILWQISILPTIEAYCGTMESKSKDDFISKCRKAFMVN